MRKLVKGLLVPTILLVAFATVGLAMAAGNSRTDRNRSRSDSGTVVLASEGGSDVTNVADAGTDRGAGRSADARPVRRGRQAPRNSDAGAGIDEKSWWWWWHNDHDDDDENDDEDDDEDQSPSNP